MFKQCRGELCSSIVLKSKNVIKLITKNPINITGDKLKEDESE